MAACPELGTADHGNFGAVVEALAEAYEQYHVCRAAALGEDKTDE